ncbi:hypothetical protein JIN77_06435 [Verrucomicrobiaceae bacterium R5-34]|nr:hypothetical protein [Verrucomicrobiaceae bacterium R5-34]
MDTKVIIAAVIIGSSAMQASANATGETKSEEKSQFNAVDAKFMDREARTKWLAKMRVSLPMASRAFGPFGYSQTPGAIVKRVQSAPKRSDAFANAIKAIKVTAVMPGQDKFVIGSQEFREGELLPLIFQGKTFNVNIVSVRMDYILFKDMSSGEHAKLQMNQLPSGMTKASEMTTVPGITPVNRGKREPLVISQ